MKEILEKYNIKPSKFRGQNFLINQGIVEKIIKAADLSKKDTVLEIGPGLGALTEELIKKAGHVIAVEKDRKLYEILRERFKNIKNLELVNADILEYNIPHSIFHIPNSKLVANLPYNITGQVFRKFLSGINRPKLLVVMVQREVGDKLLGKKPRSMLTLLRELYGNAEKVCDVSPGSFFPAPKVTSSVIKLMIDTKISDNEMQKVLRVAKVGFSSKRKKLLSNLSTALKLDKEKLKDVFLGVKLKEDVRAEELTLENWLKLAGKI